MAEPILIGGEWRQGGGAPIPSINPADRSVTAEVSSASPADVEEAVAAGWRSMDDPAWRDLKPHERAQYLLRVSGIISSRAEELAQLQMRDNGKPITETRALVASAAGTFKYYAAACETLEGEITPSRGPYLS